MPEPSSGSQVEPSATAMKAQWLAQLQELVADVRKWAEASGWRSREITRAMRDSVLGDYRAPALLLQREAVEVILNPVSRFVPGADGAVDLYLMPGYDDVASLYFVDGQWTIHYVFRGDQAVAGVRQAESSSLSEEEIVRVLDEIAAHAA